MTTSTAPAAACAGCGAVLSAGALFCLSCGAPAPRDLREQRETAPRRKAWFDVEPVPEPPPTPAPEPAPAPDTDSVTFDTDSVTFDADSVTFDADSVTFDADSVTFDSTPSTVVGNEADRCETSPRDDVSSPDVAAAEISPSDVAAAEVVAPEVAEPEVAGPEVAEPEVAEPDLSVEDREAARLEAVKQDAETEYALLKAKWEAEEAERKRQEEPATLESPPELATAVAGPDVSAPAVATASGLSVAASGAEVPDGEVPDDPERLAMPQSTATEATPSPTLEPLPDSEQFGAVAAVPVDLPRSAAETILIEQFEERIERSAFFGERPSRSKGRGKGRSNGPAAATAPELDNPDDLLGAAAGGGAGRRWFRRPAPPREPVPSSFDVTTGSAGISRNRAGGSPAGATDVVPQRGAVATTRHQPRGAVDAALAQVDAPTTLDSPSKVDSPPSTAVGTPTIDGKDDAATTATTAPALPADSTAAPRPDPAVLAAEVSPSTNAPRDVLKDSTKKAVPAQRSLEEDLDDPDAERRYAARYSTARWLLAMLVVAGLLGAGVVLLLWHRGGDQLAPANPQAQAQSLQLAAVRAWQEGNAAWASGDIATVCAAYDGVGVGGLWLDRASCMASEQQGFDRSPAANRALVGRMTFDSTLAEIVDVDAVVIWLHKAMVDGQPVTLFRDDDFAVMRVLPGQGWRQVGARYSGNVVGTVPHSLAVTSSSGQPSALASPFPTATAPVPTGTAALFG